VFDLRMPAASGPPLSVATGAAALMQGHPHLKTGTIEVLEAIEVPGM
jgi:hypothetical protein